MRRIQYEPLRIHYQACKYWHKYGACNQSPRSASALSFRSLPESLCRATVHVALDTGHPSGINEQMLADTETWVDKPDEIGILTCEIEVDPSHEACDLFKAFTTGNTGDIIDLVNSNDPAPDPPDVANATFFEISMLGTRGYDMT
ncbi:hypothetical protein K439DRAFT_1622804 [Ramaria rubella]|nr:hypothetical protein K439DRAFT_1622804 [Ramaria rubella]